jgi:hypothetical protein
MGAPFFKTTINKNPDWGKAAVDAANPLVAFYRHDVLEHDDSPNVDVPPTPNTPDLTDKALEAQRQAALERQYQQSARGRKSTFLTGAYGVPNAPSSRKTLLGGS